MRFNYKPHEVRGGLSNKEFEEDRSNDLKGGAVPSRENDNDGLYKIDPRKEAFDRAKAFREEPEQIERVEAFKEAFASSNEGGAFFATSYNDGIPPELNDVLGGGGEEEAALEEEAMME
jgi:hypothetical protein